MRHRRVLDRFQQWAVLEVVAVARDLVEQFEHRDTLPVRDARKVARQRGADVNAVLLREQPNGGGRELLGNRSDRINGAGIGSQMPGAVAQAVAAREERLPVAPDPDRQPRDVLRGELLSADRVDPGLLGRRKRRRYGGHGERGEGRDEGEGRSAIS